MKKIKSKIFSIITPILISLVLMVLAVFVWFFCLFGGQSCEKRDENAIAHASIKSQTGIEIPKDAKLVYIEGSGFQDRIYYAYFKLETFPNEWLNENLFFVGPNEEFEKNFSWVDKRIPKKYGIDFNNSYYGLEKDLDYFIFIPEDYVLIVYYSIND
ncbi:MAG: hypothetical protein E7360_04705 [Clostridiales bacterium]|nr:hypothetical protein [Clostridiales bacterium]